MRPTRAQALGWLNAGPDSRNWKTCVLGVSGARSPARWSERGTRGWLKQYLLVPAKGSAFHSKCKRQAEAWSCPDSCFKKIKVRTHRRGKLVEKQLWFWTERRPGLRFTLISFALDSDFSFVKHRQRRRRNRAANTSSQGPEDKTLALCKDVKRFQDRGCLLLLSTNLLPPTYGFTLAGTAICGLRCTEPISGFQATSP